LGFVESILGDGWVGVQKGRGEGRGEGREEGKQKTRKGGKRSGCKEYVNKVAHLY